jgi:predicted O-methyltransferase YrrM
MTEVITVAADPEEWRVGDVEFVYSFEQASTADRFCIRKHGRLVKLYADLCPQFQGARIVELGIAAGGSTALLALLASPAKLVACDLTKKRVAGLDDFIARRGLGDVVRPYYGVDQSDKAQLSEIVDAELGDQPIDLVIDDASHQWDKTCPSFEVLFSRLRPGGLLVIEDWPAQYFIADRLAKVASDPAAPGHAVLQEKIDAVLRERIPPRPPLARLAAELLLASAASSDVIAKVEVNRYWVTVTRGPADIAPDGLRVADLYTDHFSWFEPDPTSPDSWWFRRLSQQASSTTE